MLKYGLDKLYLRQFYTPAPNILYTPFGNLDRDILYWSIIGIAPAYQCIMGIVEVLAALLLLINRTRFIGLLLAIITMAQVVIINFTFDISVKMFSLLLLAMAVYAAWPQLKALFTFLLTQKATVMPKQQTVAIPVFVKAGLKCFAIGMMMLYGFTSQISMRVPNSLTGAYEVTEYEVKGRPIALHSAPVKRVFVHPKHYIIFQAQGDTMADYYFTPQSPGNSFELLGYDGQRQKLSYTKEEGKLVLRFANGTVITAKSLHWQQLPALQPQFHFTIDGIE